MGYRKSIDLGALEAPAQGNWVLIGKRTFNNESPAGVTWDISGCSKFMVDTQITAMPANYVSLVFDGDTAANYQRTQIQAQAAVTGGQVADTGMIISSWPGAMYSNMVFDRRTKIGKADMMAQYAGGSPLNLNFGYRYSGAQPMNTLGFNAAAAITGTIAVYKWVENTIPAEVVSYELVKEYKLNNQILDDTIPWDGEVDDMMRVELYTPTGCSLYAYCNGDTTVANYAYKQMYGNGSTVGTGVVGNTNGMLVLSADGYGGGVADVFLKSGLGNYRQAIGHSGANTYVTVTRGLWTNTTAPVTSMRFHTNGVAITGTIRIYKLARTKLITTNPNLNTLWHKYVDANTVQMQPGEIEINGAIMRVTKPTNVALAANLKAGLTEAASTVYYMYAVRTPGSPDLTYLFDTQAPLMDRYGNLETSFEDCEAARAWHHPTLGVNYRWVGQVFNDASKNVLAYDKCMPGYWESAWQSMPVDNAAVNHGFGKKNFCVRVIAKTALSDVGFTALCPIAWDYNTARVTYGWGVQIARSRTTVYDQTSTTHFSYAPGNYTFHTTTAGAAGDWVAKASGGYMKAFITENEG